MRLVQPGEGQPRHVVALWLVDPSMDAKLRDALGPRPCIVADGQAPPNVTLAEVLSFAKRMTGVTSSRYSLGGWSLGCSRVRKLLGDGANPAAVILADGTTNTMPPTPAKAAVWRTVADRARRSDCVMAASHTYLLYTERLRAPEVPYQATVNTLRDATGWSLPEPEDDAPAELHDNGLHIYSFRSGDADKAAHIHQVQHALPMMLRRHLRPLLEDELPDTLPASTRPASWQLSRGARGPAVAALQRSLNDAGATPPLRVDGDFGAKTHAALIAAQQRAGLVADGVATEELLVLLVATPALQDVGLAVLRAAMADLAAGIREQGHNAGADIEKLFLEPLGLPPGSDWCAASIVRWMRVAAEALGVPFPPAGIPGSPAAQGFIPQFQARGLWMPSSSLTIADVVPGTIPIWDRSTPGKPETAWRGHIGVVAEAAGAGGTFRTIEGNSGAQGNAVASMIRRLDDPRLLGLGRFT